MSAEMSGRSTLRSGSIKSAKQRSRSRFFLGAGSGRSEERPLRNTLTTDAHTLIQWAATFCRKRAKNVQVTKVYNFFKVLANTTLYCHVEGRVIDNAHLAFSASITLLV